MSEREKRIIEMMAEVMPIISEVEKAKLEGLITGAALVAKRRQENAN